MYPAAIIFSITHFFFGGCTAQHTIYEFSRERSERECERTSIHIHIIIIIFRNKEMKIWGSSRVPLVSNSMQSHSSLDQKEDAARAYKYNYLSPIHPTLDSRMSLGHASFPDIHTSATNIYFFFVSWCHCFSNLPARFSPKTMNWEK